MSNTENYLESRLSEYSKSNKQYRQSRGCGPVFLFTASAAAGMGALICPPPAEAAVQYSGSQNIVLGVNEWPNLHFIDLDGDGVDDFIFYFRNQEMSFTYFSYRYQIELKMFFGEPAAGNSMIFEQGMVSNITYVAPARLPGNYTIQNVLPASGTRQWNQAGANFLAARQKIFYEIFSSSASTTKSSSYSVSAGKFIGKRGFLGVRFQVSGSTHYGWIQFVADQDLKKAKILDWAYEDQPDTPIKAGDGRFKWNLFLPAILNGAQQN